MIPADAVANPHDLDQIKRALSFRPVPYSEFDIVITINIDPSHGEGGFTGPNGQIYVGNFMHRHGRLSVPSQEPHITTRWRTTGVGNTIGRRHVAETGRSARLSPRRRCSAGRT
jgi:hypothetical protein